MRWDNLFDDLEGQLEQELDAEQLDLLAEEERLRLGRLSLRDRLRALSAGRPHERGAPVRVRLTSGATLSLQPRTFGKDWLAADIQGVQPATQCVLPLAAIAAVSLAVEEIPTSLAVRDDPRDARLVDRIGLTFVLRDLCRRRANLDLTTAAGTVHGTIDRVGRDHVDLAVHEPGSARRTANVTDYRIVPLGTILLIRI